MTSETPPIVLRERRVVGSVSVNGAGMAAPFTLVIVWVLSLYGYAVPTEVGVAMGFITWGFVSLVTEYIERTFKLLER